MCPVLPSPFSVGDIAKLWLPVGMKELNLSGCREVTGKTGGSTLIYYFSFVGQPQHVLHSSFSLSSFLTLLPSSATGAVDKIVFPGGMQSVDFSWCKGLTGTVDLGYE